MSDEKKIEKDVEQKPFTKEILEKQIKASEEVIEKIRAEIIRSERDLEQNLGVLNYTRFLLKKYALPSIPDVPKKTDLEVK